MSDRTDQSRAREEAAAVRGGMLLAAPLLTETFLNAVVLFQDP